MGILETKVRNQRQFVARSFFDGDFEIVTNICAMGPRKVYFDWACWNLLDPSWFPQIIALETNVWMIRPPSKNEVRTTIFSMRKNTSPGSDRI